MKPNLLKRPWFEWCFWLGWLGTLVIFTQHSMASRRELQPRAAAIGWIVVALLLAFAAIVWGRRVRATHHQGPAPDAQDVSAAQSKASGE
jgi:hypothetical protein